MIIFGTSHRTKSVGRGEFYCPRCQIQRAYERKQTRRYFALYFVPLVPMGELSEFVECQTCHQAFSTDVLTFTPPTSPVGAVELLNSVKTRLLGGDPVEYIVRDLTAAGIERDIAARVVSASIGEERKYCKTCNLTYENSLAVCQECGQPLTAS